MRIVDSQITNAYPSQTNFVVEATFTWDHDVTLVYYGGTTVTLKAGEHLQVDGACFRPGGTKITAQISSGSYPVGLSACKCATIEMYDGGWQNVDNRNLYEGATVHLKAGIKIDGNGYLVPMGSFKVYEVETVHEVTTLTCYDAMKEADVMCPAEMQGEHNYIELWRLAATRLGLTPSAIDSDLGYNALATVDTQHTIRQVIEAIALACGGNAVVSGDALYVRPITSTADVTLTQWINQLEVASTPVEVTGVRVKKTFASDGQEHTYFFGAGGYVIELNDDNLWLGIEGPAGSITVAAEAVAETAYERLKNKPIYKFSGDLPADPRLDIFDKVIVKDINGREYPSIITNYTFVFSGKTSVGNSVESSSSYNTSDSGPSGSSPSGGGGGTIDVDSALSDTSTNPVQNKVITAALAGKAGTAAATTSANGLMSKADKTKLNGIAAGATKITIDSAMSGSSNNPVANHVVKQYVDDKVAAAGSNITVDAALSSTSANPVQNKAVKAAIDAKADKTALDAKADKTALNAKLDKTGGTLTGNLTGKYITGTWLQSTAASDLGRTPGKIAVLDDSGWVYYRTPSELFADLGITNAIKSYVDAAIIAAINSAY